MVGGKAMQVIWIAAPMMFYYNARYLLVNLSGENEPGSNERIEPWEKMRGNI